MSDKTYEEVLAEIGHKLTALRKNKGYTSYETFAWDHDLPRVQYWRIEKGKANCTLKSLIKVLTIHNLTLETFFAGEARDAAVTSSGSRQQ